MEENLETWKDVPGFEGLYWVSDLANVKSKKGMIKPFSTGRYLVIRCYKDGFHKDFRLHIVIFFVFNPDIQKKEKYEVDHIDQNSFNCALSNLQYISNRDNVIKSIDKTKTSSRHTGVTFCKQTGRWRAQITHNNKHYPFKRRINEIDAKQDYLNALKRIDSGLPPV